jgi:hypothetical protein
MTRTRACPRRPWSAASSREVQVVAGLGPGVLVEIDAVAVV